jgi:diaminopropionate ammonia-lyase
MYQFNTLPAYRTPLDPRDADLFSAAGIENVQRILKLRGGNARSPLHDLKGLAQSLGIGSLLLKDESERLGLGSFKALGGAYALMTLVQEEASRRVGRDVAPEELLSDAVRSVASELTFACATDGNHGRSVAQGAQLMGASAVIFVHSGVSRQRIEAIASFGARILRVDGTYDDSVAEAAHIARQNGWTLLSDTSWSGYERIPGLVMQGYTAMVQETLSDLKTPPTHVFLQAGVGGLAAAVAGHFAVLLEQGRPHVTVVDPARAACLYESARAGRPVKVAETASTIMAMLECYEPSLVAFRILERVADGFMTIDEDDIPLLMRSLASPLTGDPPIVSGESGCAGLAGVIAVLRDPKLAAAIGLNAQSRVLVINTEGATDPTVYESIVGQSPEAVLSYAKD